MAKYCITCMFCIFTLCGNAQLWSDIVSLQSKYPRDSFACGVSISFGNSLSKTEGRDYTAEDNKRVSILNPLLMFDMAYDISAMSDKHTHFFVGWNGSFYGDDCMTRLRLGVVHKKTFSCGLLLGKRIVSDKNGVFFSRRGKYRHDTTCGIFLENYTTNSSWVFCGEYSKNRLYHNAEISRRMTEYPKWWIAFGSESLRGYGPRMYYKMTKHPLCLQFSMNIAPPPYRDHENVSNSFLFSLRKTFY